MGFFEILLIAVVALLVVGPQRMPEAVRSVALTVGRIKRTLGAARREIEKQIGADDIRRQLHNEEIIETLERGNPEAWKTDLGEHFDDGNTILPEDNNKTVNTTTSNTKTVSTDQHV